MELLEVHNQVWVDIQQVEAAEGQRSSVKQTDDGESSLFVGILQQFGAVLVGQSDFKMHKALDE